MSTQKPVIVYAASGYTGKLVCEYLTQMQIPFVAAGRNLGKLEEVASEMRAKGADCVARAVQHTPLALVELMRGAKVMINTSGPFSQLGHAVVEASLEAGVHYLDITGEQDFMFDLRRDYGQRFEKAKLLLSPSASFLWTPGAAAAELALEHAGVDTVDIAYAPPSLQTVASLMSMVRSARRPGYFIDGGRLQQLSGVDVRRIELPSGEVRRGVRIGAGETTFLQGDPRVKHVDTVFTSNDLARISPVFGVWQRLGQVLDGDKLDSFTDWLVPTLKKDPPAEDRAENLFVVMVHASGAGQKLRILMHGTSPYDSTGFIAAMAAQELLAGKAKRFGYASLAQAFGARGVLKRLEEIGTKTVVEDGTKKAAQTNAAA